MREAHDIIAKAFADGRPRIGFGTGDLFYGDRGDRERLIREAFETGFRYFDTARLYGDGQAEHILGEAISGHRDEVVIASKAGIIPWSMQTRRRIAAKAGSFIGRNANASERKGAFSAKDITSSVEASLRALRTDYLDILLMHECTLADCVSDEMNLTLGRLVRDGKILAHGIAARHDETLLILRDDRMKPAIVQGPSDILARQIRDYEIAGDHLIITHSAIRPVLAALQADPALVARVHEAGIDPADTTMLASLLVAHATARNPRGVVLASTLKPERLSAILFAPETASGRLSQLEAALSPLAMQDI